MTDSKMTVAEARELLVKYTRPYRLQDACGDKHIDQLITAVRREALQDAANEAWTYALDFRNDGGHVIADRIRALAAKAAS